MKIKKILVSQPKPSNDRSPYFDLAEKNNVKIDFRPFIEVEGIAGKEFRKSKVDVTEHGAVIFTSKTAVDNFFRICEELRITVSDSMKYFCQTESIAFYLQKYIVYRKRKIFYGERKFDDLIELMQKHKDEKYLVPMSEQHNGQVIAALEKHKFKYSKAIIYKTISSDLSDLSKLNYDVLVFFSPSGIQSLLSNFPEFEQNNTKIASFGASTAKAVKEAGLRLDIQAPQPQAPSMTMALEQFIKKHNKGK